MDICNLKEKKGNYKFAQNKNPNQNSHYRQNSTHHAPQLTNRPPTRNNKPIYANGCFVCGNTNHHAKDCRLRKTNSAPQAHVTQSIDEPFVSMITELIMLENSDGWWLDKGPPRHVRHDRTIFKNYCSSKDNKVLLGRCSHYF